MVNYRDGKIYQIVNDVNDKVYIGSTCQTLCKRMSCHRTEGRILRNKSSIYLAMHEIGIGHFRILLVQNAPCDSKEGLLAIEYSVMRQFQQRGVTLYNSVIDGRCSEETLAKMSAAQMGKSLSEETREKLRGRVVSEETREKLRGRVVSEATRAKISQIRTNRGSVTHHKMQNAWRFQWCENGKKQTRNFPVKKFGTAALGLALYWQEEIYPIEREDDSELIREIRSRIEA